ncbi:FecCD family ABC transporter permease [Ezakiella peruensis]|uniref:FecCD family ABC transporter permease n=1 Tax=Ezakiella peruensis TaxID=1464038 RepID=UPI000C1B003F|nr:iron ABC transporter permease [Ezakiella peruensis]
MKKYSSLFFLFILMAAIFIAVFFGSVKVDFNDIIENIKNIFSDDYIDKTSIIIKQIRIPRVLLAALTGAILAGVGLLMQTITSNSLADSYVLGISSGASAGAVSTIVYGLFSTLGRFNVYIGAFVGAILSTILLVFLQGRNRNQIRLVLMGMGISGFFSAMTAIFIFNSKNEAQVRSATYWMMGSLTGANYKSLIYIFAALIILLVFVFIYHKELDLLFVGLDGAQNSGLEIRPFQLKVVIVSSMAIAVLVSEVGVIGFVGLIVPHIIKKISFFNHRRLFIDSILSGAAFVVICDIFARTLYAPRELPIGVVTGFVGAPIFIYMIKKGYKDA